MSSKSQAKVLHLKIENDNRQKYSFKYGFFIFILVLSSSTSGHDTSSNLWPELCQMNQFKHSMNKKDLTDAGTSYRITNLEDSEYPELNNTNVHNKNFVTFKKQCLPKPIIEDLSLVQSSSIEPKKSKKFRRTDKICINLQEALQVSLNVKNCLKLYRIVI